MLRRFAALLLMSLVFVLSAAVGENPARPLWLEGEKSAPQVEIALPSFAPVIEKLGKAVVNISIEGKEKVASPFARSDRFGAPKGGEGQQSPFDFFFQFPPDGGGESKRSFQSLGSGFVIHPDGYIVTNYHVVEKATKIQVSFRDNKKPIVAKVVGADKKTDLALLKVDTGSPLPAVVFGDSTQVRPGDWVLAIGNPFRLGHTATVGIVSAKSRKVPGGGPYDDFIQTDASINPGNSGGPLFNARGEVVGVNTAIFSPGATGFNIGIGFAIPINMVKDIIEQLHTKGKVTRGWLGVLIQEVSDDAAQALGLTEAKGALVAQVMKGSPAEKAGIKRGDVIVEYDGKAVEMNDELPMMVAKTEIGKKVPVEVVRQGSKISVKVVVEALEEGESAEQEQTESEENRLGLAVQDLSPELVALLGLTTSQGVIVTDVAGDSPAESAGLRRRDVILEVDSKPVANAEEFRKIARTVEKNKPVLLLVLRDKNTVFLTLRLE